MKPRFISIALSIISFCPLAPAQWVQTNGPFGGPVSRLATSGTNLFAGSDSAIFLSTNNGTNWTRTSFTGAVVHALLVCGANLFAGTDHGVFLSTNNGTDWMQLNRGLTDTNVTSFTVAGPYLFAGTKNGKVFRSADNGETWSFNAYFYGPLGYGERIQVLTYSGTSLFAGTTLFPPPPPPPHIFHGFAGVYRSTDYGASWTEVISGLPWIGGLVVLSIAVQGTKVFAGTSAGLFVSTNNGSSWSPTTGPGGIFSFAVSGTNLFAGTGGGVFLSTDNGTSWTQRNTGLTHISVGALCVSGANLFAATNGGVFLSSNNGTSWSVVNTGLNYSSEVKSVVVPYDLSTNIFAGTGADGVFLSTHGGSSWTPINDGLTNPSISTLAVSGTNLFAGAWNGIYLSSNNGLAWTVEYGAPISLVTCAFAFLGTYVFAATSGVIRSTDYGMSWTAASTGLTNTDVRALAVSGTNLFAGTAGGGVYLSTDRGTSWTAVNTGLADTNVAVLVVSGSNLFAGTFRAEVFLSTNNGVGWTAVGSLPSNSEIISFYAIGKNLFAATFNNGIFLSTDNGATWTAFNSGLTNLATYSVVACGTEIYAGTDHGVWRRPLSQLNVKLVSRGFPEQFNLLQNYPNPFNPTTVISYQLPVASKVDLNVYDVLGREVFVLVNEKKDAGRYQVKFDGSGLASGVYFYRLQAENFVQTKKLLLLR